MAKQIEDLEIALDIARANLDNCKDLAQVQKLVDAVAEAICDLSEAKKAAQS